MISIVISVVLLGFCVGLILDGLLYLILPIGLRKSGTEVGTWTGAWVVTKRGCTTYTLALFHNQRYYIQENATLYDIFWYIIEFKWKAWHWMCREDIMKTAGDKL